MATSLSLLGAATPRLSPGQLMAGRRGQRAGLERPTSESQRLSASRMLRLIAELQRGRFRGRHGGVTLRENLPAASASARAAFQPAGKSLYQTRWRLLKASSNGTAAKPLAMTLEQA